MANIKNNKNPIGRNEHFKRIFKLFYALVSKDEYPNKCKTTA